MESARFVGTRRQFLRTGLAAAAATGVLLSGCGPTPTPQAEATAAPATVAAGEAVKVQYMTYSAQEQPWLEPGVCVIVLHRGSVCRAST